jgi:hypothetical protein
MPRSTPECDWKYAKTVHDALLASLCARINARSAAILEGSSGSEHEKYLKLYRHIHKSDQIIGECFNGFRRSTLLTQLAAMQKHGILTPNYVEHLSPQTQASLAILEEMRNG